MPGKPNSTSGAIAWAAIETFSRQGIQFVSGIFLARLLTPTDFGLVAMLSIFVALAGLLTDSGFGTALIQQVVHSDTDASTVFWFNMCAGTAMALALGFSAPLIARFFHHPELILLTWAMALNLWLACSLSVHGALLTRKLNFRVQAKASAVANVVGATLAIALAFSGAGVWSLVAQTLMTTFINVILIWALHRWRPTATFSFDSIRRLFGFGGFMLAASVLNAASTRFYSVLIGRLYTSHDLGLYTRGVTTRDVFQRMLGTIFSRVSLPILSQHGSNADALRKRLKVANQLTMAINLPAMIGLAVVADVAIPTLFGQQWRRTVPILQIMCLAGTLYPMQVSNLQVLIAQGHSSAKLYLEVFKKAILIGAMLLASHWGMSAIAWSTVFASVTGFALNSRYSRIMLRYGIISQLRDISGYVGLSIVMGIVVFMLGHWLVWITPGKRLGIEVIVGASFYIALAAYFRMPAISYAFQVLRSIRVNINDDSA